MVQFQGYSCTMLSTIAFVTVMVLFIIAPIQGQTANSGGQPYGLDPSFVSDPFYNSPAGPSNTHSSYPSPGAPFPADFPPGYHSSAASGSSPTTQHPSSGSQNNSPQYQLPNIYHYNSNPYHHPNPNQYQYNGQSYQAPGSYQYPYNSNLPTTTLSPVPPAAPSQNGGGEYEYEDGGQAPSSTGGTGYQPSALPPVQHNWHYDNYGIGSGSNSRPRGLLEVLGAPHRHHHQQQQAQANIFNNPLFYLALAGW